MNKHYTNTSNPVDFPRLTTIDRLWGEALDRAVPDTYSSLTWEQVERIKAVFAELIVRECVGIVAKRKDQAIDDGWNVDEAMSMAEMDLLEHFGVEE